MPTTWSNRILALSDNAMEALVKMPPTRSADKVAAKVASQMISHVDPANWMIGTNTKTATRVVVARRAISNAHRSGFCRRYSTSTAPTPSACAATIVVGVEKTRPMTSGTSERESQRSLPDLPTSSTNTSVTANPAASIHQGTWIRPSGAGIESAVIRRSAEEIATSTPVRHQTRTAPLIRGRDDLRWASITRPLSSHATIRRERRGGESVLGLVSPGARRKTFGCIFHAPA
jgi:hypothetical protein